MDSADHLFSRAKGGAVTGAMLSTVEWPAVRTPRHSNSAFAPARAKIGGMILAHCVIPADPRAAAAARRLQHGGGGAGTEGGILMQGPGGAARTSEEEVMQPCPIYLHLISSVGRTGERVDPAADRAGHAGGPDTERGTKDMMQPCLIYLHTISLEWMWMSDRGWASGGAGRQLPVAAIAVFVSERPAEKTHHAISVVGAQPKAEEAASWEHSQRQRKLAPGSNTSTVSYAARIGPALEKRPAAESTEST